MNDKTLSQKPCDDAVSREAVIEILGDYGCTNREGLIFKDIRALPSVTQKSKTGHWKKKEDDTCWWYVCSECEQEPLKNRLNDDDVLSAFCPNCGCRMVEPQESEDKE